jgi:hypothetical protein
MNDYLTQLVTYGLDTGAVVRPRPTPLFAPDRATVRPEFETEIALEEPTVAPISRPIHRLAAQAPLDMPHTQAERPPLAPGSLEATSLRRLAPPAPIDTPDDVAQPAETIAPRLWPAQAALQPSSPPAAAHIEPPHTPSASDTPPRDGADRSVWPAPAAPALVIERVVVSEPPHPADAPRPAPPSLVVAQPRVAPAPADIQPRPHAPLTLDQLPINPRSASMQSARRSIPPSAAPQPATTAEPTIHVTIGRVEVRATPQPAPAAKPTSAAAPTMSLDEYLRARDGGRR